MAIVSSHFPVHEKSPSSGTTPRQRPPGRGSPGIYRLLAIDNNGVWTFVAYWCLLLQSCLRLLAPPKVQRLSRRLHEILRPRCRPPWLPRCPRQHPPRPRTLTPPLRPGWRPRSPPSPRRHLCQRLLRRQRPFQPRPPRPGQLRLRLRHLFQPPPRRQRPFQPLLQRPSQLRLRRLDPRQPKARRRP